MDAHKSCSVTSAPRELSEFGPTPRLAGPRSSKSKPSTERFVESVVYIAPAPLNARHQARCSCPAITDDPLIPEVETRRLMRSPRRSDAARPPLHLGPDRLNRVYLLARH